MTWAAAVLMLPLVVDGSTNHSVNYAGEAAGNIAGNGVSRAAGKRTAGPVSVQPDYLEICRGILQQKLEHPYLVFTNESKKEILERVRTDPFAAEVMALLKHYGERSMLTTVEPELTINDPAARYTETNPYLDYQMFYLNGAYNLAFLYQMTGEQAYADRAFYFVNKLCAMDTWVQSAPLFRNHLSEGVALRGPRRSGVVLLRYFRSRLRLCRGPGLRLALPGARQTAA